MVRASAAAQLNIVMKLGLVSERGLQGLGRRCCRYSKAVTISGSAGRNRLRVFSTRASADEERREKEVRPSTKEEEEEEERRRSTSGSTTGGVATPAKRRGRPIAGEATNVAVDVWGTGKLLYEQTGGIAGGGRVRQHINPLKTELQKPTAPPEWREKFEDCSLPLEVDVGCGSGRFILARARRHVGEANFLGLDIRSKLVERSNKWAKFLDIPNVYYLSSNATISLEAVLESYPGKVSFVSVQYPDPHFKKKHHKRRIVQRDFIEQLGRVLDEVEGHVFLQSDVLEVARDMCERFDQSESFRRATKEEVLKLAKRNNAMDREGVVSEEEEEEEGGGGGGDVVNRGMNASAGAHVFNKEGWITFNPSGMPTEREVHATADGEEVYRALFRKREGDGENTE